MRPHTRIALACLVALSAITLTTRGTVVARVMSADPGIGPDTVEVLPYQSGSYRFLSIGLGDSPPAGFELPAFNDAAFATGAAPFGTGGGCPIQSTVVSPWPVNTRLLVRRAVTIPAGATNVRIMAAVDNDIVAVYFNGTLIAGLTVHNFCPDQDDFRFDVPQALVQTGQNTMVFHLLDRGEETYFDSRVLVDVSDIDVLIDIKPGSFPNGLNPRQRGVVPVAIMTTPTFDAATVDRTTIRFGKTGIEAAPLHIALEDWDHDGDLDMILQFEQLATGIQCGDTSAKLTAKTLGGTSIEGIDSVKTAGCK
jgi:hypothetical protein